MNTVNDIVHFLDTVKFHLQCTISCLIFKSFLFCFSTSKKPDIELFDTIQDEDKIDWLKISSIDVSCRSSFDKSIAFVKWPWTYATLSKTICKLFVKLKCFQR